MVTAQQKWNRYVDAINYCIGQGILINMKDSKGGNVAYIKAKWDYLWCINSQKDVTIKLKPKKYKPTELYNIIVSYLGKPIYKNINVSK